MNAWIFGSLILIDCYIYCFFYCLFVLTFNIVVHDKTTLLAENQLLLWKLRKHSCC